MKELALADIADVLSGYSFRTKVEHDPEGDLRVIQARDIRADLTLDLGGLTRIRLKDAARPERKLVKRDDVLVMVRTEQPYAVHLPEDMPPAIVQNSFNTLRVRSEAVLPEFLAMMLNQGVMQSRMTAAIAATATIPYIKVQDLRALKVPVPPLERQRTLVALEQALRREQALHRALQKARQAQLEALILID